jgi:hypothetical protein
MAHNDVVLQKYVKYSVITVPIMSYLPNSNEYSVPAIEFLIRKEIEISKRRNIKRCYHLKLFSTLEFDFDT